MNCKMKSIIAAFTGAVVGGVLGTCIAGRIEGEVTTKAELMSEKHLALFQLMNKWVNIKQEGKNISNYLQTNNYNTIAIYGMSYVGETLINELKGSSIKIVCGIDQKAERIYSEIEVVSLDKNIPPVDAVIVTAITYFDEIEEKLSKKVSCPIISLEDILYDL